LSPLEIDVGLGLVRVGGLRSEEDERYCAGKPSPSFMSQLTHGITSPGVLKYKTKAASVSNG
jgi:hypothetical protein